MQSERAYRLSDTIFVASLKCFNKCVQCMTPSLVTAFETPVKYFAMVENQQKWRERYKKQDKKSSDSKRKVFFTQIMHSGINQ